MAGGQGTPWGPMEYGKPGDLQLETDPSKIKGFDYSELKKAALEDIASAGGDAQRQYLAGSSKALGSGSSSGSRMGRLAGLAADTQKNQARTAMEFALREWQDKQGMMDSINRARQAKYNAENANYQGEQNQRGQAVGNLLNPLALLTGGYLGGK